MRNLLFLLLTTFLTTLSAQQTDLTQHAQKIAKSLAKNAKTLQNKSTRLDYFTYEDSEMGSIFSRDLYEALTTALEKEGITIRENSNDLTQQQAALGKDNYAIVGIYSEKNDKLEVKTYLFDLKTKKNIQTIKEVIPNAQLLNEQSAWKPQRFEQAKNTRNLIVEDDATPEPSPTPKPDAEPTPSPEPAPSHGDFELAVMTSKGFGHQIFTQGERMQIAVKTDRDCFLRLVYHTADGQKVLLLENEAIKKSADNNYVTVPQQFECAEPFGIETIQLFASTELYPPLKTHLESGFLFIDEPIGAVNQKTRGFKPVLSDKNGKKVEFGKAEVSLQVTTLPK
jgi:Domain of unknown function (DUF4384)